MDNNLDFIEFFGKTSEGKESYLYTLGNAKGTFVHITDYGAAIVSILLLNAEGKTTDVILGFDHVSDYEKNDGCFGGIIGRVANRTKGAQFTLEEKIYRLEINSNNADNLHSSLQHGYHKRLWEMIERSSNRIHFQLISADGDQGFPGTVVINIIYTLYDDNRLEIKYLAQTDAKTVVNMTNHSYFNLSGHDTGSIEDTILEIKADFFTPFNEKQIPGGELRSVKETPLDFTKPKHIGDDIDVDDDQIKFGGGYDHNYVLNSEQGELQLAAVASSKQSGYKLEVYTDLPGIQLYTGNGIKDMVGKGGAKYTKRSGFCLETQYFPNCLNEKRFACPYVNPEKSFESVTIFKFY